MRIDPTIHRALDAGTLTIEQVLEAVMTAVLEKVETDCLADGYAAADIKPVVEKLRKTRPARLETLRQMLEARATMFPQ